MGKTVRKEERKASKWVAIKKARNFKMSHTGSTPTNEREDETPQWKRK